MEPKQTPPPVPGQRDEEQRPDQHAGHGRGSLLQRDYVVVLEGSHCTPEAVVRRLREEFPRYSPDALAKFTRPEGAAGLLDVDDTMHIVLRGAGEMGVRVAHLDAQRLTLQTLEGHQEAGHITFGAYHDEAGRLVCRIRSRARQANLPRLVAYHLLGIHAQTAIWVAFLECLAEECGGRMLGPVMTSTDETDELPSDRGEVAAPTFDVP
jgi:hypothetical protein